MTFNYDMMIERALRDREIAVTDTDSYVNNATRQLTRTACELGSPCDRAGQPRGEPPRGRRLGLGALELPRGEAPEMEMVASPHSAQGSPLPGAPNRRSGRVLGSLPLRMASRTFSRSAGSSGMGNLRLRSDSQHWKQSS